MATKAHLEGNKRYLQTQDNITIRVPKGEKAIIQEFAKSQGKSLNAFVVDLIREAMNKD